VGELAGVPLSALVTALGPALGRHLHDLAWARDARPVEPERAVKSIGHEETYAQDIADLGRLGTEAVRMADAVSARLRQAGLTARTVTIKVRFHDFATITRSHTLPVGVATGPELAAVATVLLDTVDPGAGVRLFGLSASNLEVAGGRQLSFAEGDDTGWHRASRAVDAVRRRFGDAAVGPASLVAPGGLRVKRTGDTQWGPGVGGEGD
jgi:DNA polymerase-4